MQFSPCICRLNMSNPTGVIKLKDGILSYVKPNNHRLLVSVIIPVGSPGNVLLFAMEVDLS